MLRLIHVYSIHVRKFICIWLHFKSFFFHRGYTASDLMIYIVHKKHFKLQQKSVAFCLSLTLLEVLQLIHRSCVFLNAKFPLLTQFCDVTSTLPDIGYDWNLYKITIWRYAEVCATLLVHHAPEFLQKLRNQNVVP